MMSFTKDESAKIPEPKLFDVGSIQWAGLSARELTSIEAPVLIALGFEPQRLIPLVKLFLRVPEKQIPLATRGSGYHPGETK